MAIPRSEMMWTIRGEAQQHERAEQTASGSVTHTTKRRAEVHHHRAGLDERRDDNLLDERGPSVWTAVVDETREP